MDLTLIIIAFLGIAAYEAPPLIRGERYRELVVAGSIWLLALLLSVLLNFDIAPPSPTDLMRLVSEAVLYLLRLVF